jgi:hypothetical protein
MIGRKVEAMLPRQTWIRSRTYLLLGMTSSRDEDESVVCLGGNYFNSRICIIMYFDMIYLSNAT